MHVVLLPIYSYALHGVDYCKCLFFNCPVLKKKENSTPESSETFSELQIRIEHTTLRFLVRTL